MTGVLTEIISLLTAGITGIAAGIGAGLSELVQNIFVANSGEGEWTLTTFGGLVVVFAGVSLAIGLSRFIVNWVTSLGASN